jgi:DNA primase
VTRYAADSRDRVRDAVDMIRLVEPKVDMLRRAGVNSYFGRCPFHDENTPSFHIRPDEKHYHCFGCAESGDPFDFVMATEGLDFIGALESLADRFGVALQTEDEDPEAAARRQRRERLYSLLTRTATFYERMLWQSREGETARRYLLEERGLSEDGLRRFRVGLSPLAWDRVLVGSRQAGFSDEEMLAAGLIQRSKRDATKLFDRFRAQVMFPTADSRGRVIGFGARKLPGDEREWLGKYVNTAEGDIYSKRSVLYGIQEARSAASKAGRMVLAEGYTDVIALHQAGVQNAVGIMGTSLTREQVAELVRLVKVLELCLDADSAGQEAMARAAQLCAETGLELRVVALPSGADPGDLIRRAGPQALADRVRTSVPYVVFEVGRTLDGADLASAEGRDAAIATLAPALARVPESILRDELLREVAGRVAIPESRLVALLGRHASEGPSRQPEPSRAPRPGPGAGEGAGGADPGPAPAPARIPRLVELGVKTERDYIVMCLVAGEIGRQEMSRIDPDRLISSAVLRRALRSLSGQGMLTDPGSDAEMSAVIDDLESRAATAVSAGREVSVEGLEHARLLLELASVDRDLERAKAAGQGIAQLARRRQEIRTEIGGVVARLERAL